MQNFKLSCLCTSPSGALSISRPGLFIPSTSPLVGLSIARRPVFTSPETQISSVVFDQNMSAVLCRWLWWSAIGLYSNTFFVSFVKISWIAIILILITTKLSLTQFPIYNSKLRSELNAWKEDFLWGGLEAGGHIWHTVSANGRSGTRPCHRMDPD